MLVWGCPSTKQRHHVPWTEPVPHPLPPKPFPKIHHPEITYSSGWAFETTLLLSDFLTRIITLDLHKSQGKCWYPSCLTHQGALYKGIYPINTHYIRCIWACLLRGPHPKGPPPFSLRKKVNFNEPRSNERWREIRCAEGKIGHTFASKKGGRSRWWVINGVTWGLYKSRES